MTVPYAFANLSGNIALAKLDSNFNTPITIGNTSVLLGNTVTTLNNLTLANVTITSGTGANISLTSPLAVSSGGTGIANLTVNNVLIGNGTNAITSVAPGTTGNVLTSIGGVWVSNVAVTSAAAGANTQVQYNSANLLAGSANLTFDGTNLGLAGGTANGVAYLNGSKVLTTGSALTFDGGNLGLGVTPSAWSGVKAFQLTNGSSSIGIYGAGGNEFGAVANTYYNGTNWIYSTTNTSARYAISSGQHVWSTAPSGTAGNAITFTQAMTLDASGNLLVGTTSAVSGGGVLQVSNGITFPATQSASSDANTLDDYEEGTFTPTYFGSTTAGTTTYTSQLGTYTKVGNRVDFALTVAWSNATGTGSGKIGSLPFTAANLYSSASIATYSFAYPALSIPVPRLGYGTSIDILSITTGGSSAGGTIAITTSGTINISGTYFV